MKAELWQQELEQRQIQEFNRKEEERRLKIQNKKMMDLGKKFIEKNYQGLSLP